MDELAAAHTTESSLLEEAADVAEDRLGAVLDVAGAAAIPGGKFVTEGIEHAVDGFNATRHLDDGLDAASSGAHHVPDAPSTPR